MGTQPEPPAGDSAVGASAASVAAAMWAAAESLQARLELVIDERLGTLTADQRGFLQVARRDGQRLRKLIADFRDMALAEAGALPLDWARVDLAEVANEAIAALLPRAQTLGKDIVLQAAQPSAISADPERTRDAITRLVQQAVQHGAPGGEIELVLGDGTIAICYEAEEAPTLDSLPLAFAASMARAHGGFLTVERAETRISIAACFAARAGSVVPITAAA